ncbi:MAG: glycosyltransferase [Nitrospiraceae bacterium]
MNVLFLTDPALDYLADQIYIGLCKVLGWRNIFDFPPKAAYHDPASRVSYLPQNPGHDASADDLICRIRDHRIDLVLVSSPRRGPLEAYHLLAKHVRFPPTILLDGEDDSRIRADLYRSVGAGLYFKRELKPSITAKRSGLRSWWTGSQSDPDQFLRIHPLSFSVIEIPVHPPVATPPDIDISFAGRASHRKRVRAVNLLRRSADIRFEGGVYIDSRDRRSKLGESLCDVVRAKLCGDPPAPVAERGRRLGTDEYQALLRRSKMALSIRGGGFDTIRYWEIVASKILLISEPPDILIPDNFEHGVHAMFCRSDLRDLPALVRRLRDDDAVRSRMVNAAFEHLTAFHTSERRATYLLDTCRRLL